MGLEINQGLQKLSGARQCLHRYSVASHGIQQDCNVWMGWAHQVLGLILGLILNVSMCVSERLA